jgi:hypothetical protein
MPQPVIPDFNCNPHDIPPAISGVPVTVSEKIDVPLSFTARTSNEYSTSGVSPNI